MRAIVDDALADQVRRLERERDTLAAQLAALRDCASADGTTVSGPCGACARCLRDGRASAHARAISVEAQLAALRGHSLAFFDAVANLRRIGPPAVEGTSAEIDAYCDSMEALESSLTAAAPAVEAYTRRVQAEALESAADNVCDHEQLAEGRTLAAERSSLQRWLRARAAEIRGGR